MPIFSVFPNGAQGSIALFAASMTFDSEHIFLFSPNFLSPVVSQPALYDGSEALLAKDNMGC